jgi:adenylate cyclase
MVCALAAWALAQVPMMRGLEDWLLDGAFVLRGRRPSSAQVLLVSIDDASLKQLKKPIVYLSPELAEVVRYLHDQGAAAIGIDVLIPESYRGLPALQAGGEGDPTLMGLAVERSGRVVLPEWQVEGQMLRPLTQWQLKYLSNPDPQGMDFGFVNLTEDGDQFVRRQQLAVPGKKEHLHYQFALAMMARARGILVEWDSGWRRLLLAGAAVPLDRDQMLRINFVGPPGTFPLVTLSQVLEAARRGEATPGVRGAIVIVGSTEQSGQDIHNTPYGNRYADYLHRTGPGLMSGPELHANVLATLHDRAYITTPWYLSTLPWLLLLGVVLGQAFFRLGLVSGFVLAVVHHFAWKGVALAAFWYGNWRVEASGMFLLGALAYSVAFAWRWRVLRRVLRAVKSAPIAQALESDPGRLGLAGEAREVTVLFADIRGFTDFSEWHTPAEVVALLNAYYQRIVPLIDAEGGVIDKFIGDGLMVLFGAISERPDHAAAAVRAALSIVRSVGNNQSVWAERGFDGLRIGIGIHTGTVVVGAVGAPTRLDFTAIGDTVNAASRVEGENKRVGSSILITEATLAAVPAEQRVALWIREEAIAATVKGKQVELSLHVVDDPGAGVVDRDRTEDQVGTQGPGIADSLEETGHVIPHPDVGSVARGE